jgi:signal peptidase I
VAVLTAISILTFGWLLTPVRVSGISMEPTYRDSTLNLVNRMTFRMRAPRRGDVSPVRTSCM